MERKYKILLTCKPMITRLGQFDQIIEDLDMEVDVLSPMSVQEDKLIQILPQYDAWIMGEETIRSNAWDKGRLKVCIKWGSNKDEDSGEQEYLNNIYYENVQGLFEDDIADMALGYLIGLAKNIVTVNWKVRQKDWFRPQIMSLKNKRVAIFGGKNISNKISNRILAFNMKVTLCEDLQSLKNIIPNTDFLILCCDLKDSNHHLIDEDVFQLTNDLYLISVSPGGIVKESALVKALDAGNVRGAALESFECEPMDPYHHLKQFEYLYNTIFGSNNASNTAEGIDETGKLIFNKLKYLFKNHFKQ